MKAVIGSVAALEEEGPPVGAADVLAEYATWAMDEGGLQPAVAIAHQDELTSFLRYLRLLVLGFAEVRAAHVHAWCNDPRSLTREQKEQRYQAARSFYDFLLWSGYLSQHPLSKDKDPYLAPPARGRSVSPSLTDAEIDRLLAFPRTDDADTLRVHAMLFLLFVSRMKPEELVKLRLDQLVASPDKEGSDEALVLVCGTTFNPRQCFIVGRLRLALERYLREGRASHLSKQFAPPTEYLFPAGIGALGTLRFWREVIDHGLFCGLPMLTAQVIIRTLADDEACVTLRLENE